MTSKDHKARGRNTAVPAAIALLTVVMTPAAFAQDGSDSKSRPVSVLLAQAGRTVTFDIAAQPLSQALTAYGRQTGLQIAVDTATVTGKSTAGVSGAMTSEQGLRQLLSGTGLSYQFTSASAVTVVGATPGSSALQLDPVRVQGTTVPAQAEVGTLMPRYAGGLVARGGRLGDLGNRDYMDTPFSTTVYTDKYIQDNQARTLADALAGDPTIRPTYAQGVYDDRLYIRGFYLDPGDMSFNGLYGINPITSVDLTGIERIEVFRGPTALLSGMSPIGSVGGTINLVPKRATDTPIT